METTTLSTKGQIILPKSVRDSKHLKSGMKFAVEVVQDGILLRPLHAFPPTKIEDLYGVLKYTGRPKTLREMDQAIEREVAARRARGRY